MIKRRTLTLVLLAVLLVSAVWALTFVLRSESAVPGTPVSVAGGTYTNITPAQLAEMLKNKDFVFVNTHIPYEGEIAVTDEFILYDQIGQSLEALPADKSARIVLYCRSGNMSATASETLVQLGYTNVYNLAGGMKAWREAGFAIIENGDNQ